jgi:hypothetical protein
MMACAICGFDGDNVREHVETEHSFEEEVAAVDRMISSLEQISPTNT